MIGSDHHNTLGVIRGLGERGLKSDVILVSHDKSSFVGKSKYVNTLYYIPNVSCVIDCLLANYKNEEKKPVIICCADPIEAEIDQHYKLLRDYFYLPGSEKQGRITELMSKQCMAELACTVGLSIPKSWYFDEEISEMPEISTPCIVKPLLSKDGKKTDIRIFKDKDQLWTYLKKGQLKKAQIQEFIDKDFEYQLIGCATPQEVIIPGVSIILRPCKGSNTSFLHYTPIEKGFCDIDKCYEFVRRTGYRGLFSLEFLRDKNGNDYFMEINFRNDGNAICTTAAGVCLPYIWYMSCLGLDYSEEAQKEVSPIYVMPDMAELKLLLTCQISIVQFIRDFRKTGRFMEYDKQDPKPFWYMLRKELRLCKSNT